ncbi:MAG: spore germination protein GerPE [Anoxybacillus sp.]|nr:spore germination protein GerPE [Anoxybacillus sp.]MCL6585729.1 spore germination protein GerPE [Anoxybacillus sp.]
MKRLSVVQLLNSKTFLLSSVLQIGDSREINARSNVLAVQRQYELFYGSEGEVVFPVFTKPIPTLDVPMSVQTYRLHESPVISVRSIYLIAASTASVVHIGSTSTVKGETRIKHIRQLAESTTFREASIRMTKDG